MSTALDQRMRAVACPDCGWWKYDVRHDSPRAVSGTPHECPDCRVHHGQKVRVVPVWITFEERA